MKKTLILTTMVFLLGACSSGPARTTSYLLTRPEQTATADFNAATQVIILAPVSMDSLLENQGIVYQTSATETVVARQHLWAENLSTQLSRRLLNGLRQSQGEYWVMRSDPQMNTSSALRLLVSFSQFNGSYLGNAVISGDWTLLNGQGDLLQSQPFRYQEPLASDGYPALVNALSQATDRLTAELSQSLTGLKTAARFPLPAKAARLFRAAGSGKRAASKKPAANMHVHSWECSLYCAR